MSMCRVISCVFGRGCLLWPVHPLGKTLLAFSDMVSSNKKLLETISELKKVANTVLAMTSVFSWQNSLSLFWYSFKQYQDWKRLLTLTLPAPRSSGAGKSHLTFMSFGFWFLGISLPFVSFGVWLLPGEVLVCFCFVCLAWVHRHLVQTAQANVGIAHYKVPHSTWEPLGEKNFPWLINL